MQATVAVGAAAGMAVAIYLGVRRRRAWSEQQATVHLFPPTTCSRRVLMCLAELGCVEECEYIINPVSTTGPNSVRRSGLALEHAAAESGSNIMAHVLEF